MDTAWVFNEAVKAAHPGSAVVASRAYNLNVFAFPEARISKVPKTELVTFLSFVPPARRGLSGGLAMEVAYGCFKVEWASRTFLMYVLKVCNGL